MRSKLLFSRVLGAAAIATAVVVVGAATASAAGPPVVSPPIVDGLAGPLQFQVAPTGHVLVGQSFGGTVSLVSPGGTVKDLFNDPGVDGVAAGPFGSVLYTHTEEGVAQLRLRTYKGRTITVADLYAHEAARNPDQNSRYGLMGLSAECAAQLPPDQGILPYKGGLDSHPYAITPTLGGVLVADAGGNDILFADLRGHVHTVAVLPPQPPVPVTPEAAAANELPPCTAGSKFVAEPVPTDVEIGPDGQLYVSALPGGPEGPTLGARGAVYRVNPWTGRVTRLASGFLGATNVAVSPRGTIYVTELFGDKVSKVVGDHGVVVATVPQPSGLEWSRGRLYVSTDSFGSGKIVTISG